MGLQIRDDRQMKALTGLSHAQFAHLLPVFNDIYQTTQQQTYEKGVVSGTRTRTPGGGSKGKLPTMADKLLFVLYYYKTYPTFDVLSIWTETFAWFALGAQASRLLQKRPGWPRSQARTSKTAVS